MSGSFIVMAKGMRLVGLFALAAVALWGCGGSSGGDSGPRVERPEVRFVNASADTSGLDFRVDDETVVSALDFGGSTPNFQQFDADSYDVTIRDAGQEEDAWAEVFNLESDQNYVIASFGLRRFGEDAFKRLRVTAIPVDRSVPNGNKARLIILNSFNRAPEFQNVLIDFQNPGTNPQFSARDIGFGGTSTLLVDSGEQTFEARQSGAEQVFASESVTLESGKVYFVVVGGTEGETGNQAPDLNFIELQTETD